MAEQRIWVKFRQNALLFSVLRHHPNHGIMMFLQRSVPAANKACAFFCSLHPLSSFLRNAGLVSDDNSCSPGSHSYHQYPQVSEAFQGGHVVLCTHVTLRLTFMFQFHSDASEMRVLVSPMTVLGAITPTFRWNPGLNWCWERRATGRRASYRTTSFNTYVVSAYVNHTHEVISLVPILYGRRMYYLGSLNLFKQLLFAENKLHIEKPQDMLKSMLFVLSSSSGFIQFLKFTEVHSETISSLRMAMCGNDRDASWGLPSLTQRLWDTPSPPAAIHSL